VRSRDAWGTTVAELAAMGEMAPPEVLRQTLMDLATGGSAGRTVSRDQLAATTD
jgi:hypothetical protein